ncbi:hypothetical protein ACXZ65_34515 [Streptomyces aculeolatus]
MADSRTWTGPVNPCTHGESSCRQHGYRCPVEVPSFLSLYRKAVGAPPRDTGWTDGIERTDSRGDDEQIDPELAALLRQCPAKHGALGRICELGAGHDGMHTGEGPNGGATWEGSAR